MIGGPIVLAMVLGVLVDYCAHSYSAATWQILAVPPADDPLITQLNGLNTLWEYQLTLCTFILTFFTSQAYSHWRTVYFTTRAIQGRINDIALLLAIGAQRTLPEMAPPVAESVPLGQCKSRGQNEVDLTDDGSQVSKYSEEGAALVARCTRLIRLSHTFFWAATPTCSNGVGDGGIADGDERDELPRQLIEKDAIGPLLLSAQGLQRLVDEGELTAHEVDAMVATGLPPSQYTYILLEWVGLHAMRGLRDGTLRGGDASRGFEEVLLTKLAGLRAEYFNIGDLQAGRMPLAYVQLVQVLVDSLVVLAPLALYPEAGSLSIPLAGLLTLFFKGLLELSKSFLDPFGNEGYPGQNVRVDVLVSELNFGAGSRWVRAGEALPL